MLEERAVKKPADAAIERSSKYGENWAELVRKNDFAAQLQKPITRNYMKKNFEIALTGTHLYKKTPSNITKLKGGAQNYAKTLSTKRLLKN